MLRHTDQTQINEPCQWPRPVGPLALPPAPSRNIRGSFERDVACALNSAAAEAVMDQRRTKGIYAVRERKSARHLGVAFERSDGTIEVQLGRVPREAILTLHGLAPRVLAQEVGT